MIYYKINVLKALKEKGYTTSYLRSNKIFGESTIQKFREEKPVTFDHLDRLCSLLDCQPSDIIGYKKDE